MRIDRSIAILLTATAAAPALAQEQSAEAMMAVLSGGNCVMPLAEAPRVLGSQGFTEGFVRETLTGMVIDGTAWVEPGGVLRIDDSICPAADLSSAPATPRAVFAEALRAAPGCAVRQDELDALFPNVGRETITAITQAMVAEGEALVDRFTLRVAGEGCPDLAAVEAPMEEMVEAVPAPEVFEEVEVGAADDGDAAAMTETDGDETPAEIAVEAAEDAGTVDGATTEGATETVNAMQPDAPETSTEAAEDAVDETVEAASDEDLAEVAIDAVEEAEPVEGDATDGAGEMAASDDAASDEIGAADDGDMAAMRELAVPSLRDTLLAAAATRDCAIRQSQIAAVLPDADADELLAAVMALVDEGSAEIDRFTLRLSEEACAASR